MTQPAIAVRGLSVRYPGPPGTTALDRVDLTVPAGGAVGLVGESGSGKSSLAHAVLGLLPDEAASDALRLHGRELHDADEPTWRAVRWRDVTLVPQSTAALTPTLPVGRQVAEALEEGHGVSRRAARAAARRALRRVGLDATLAAARPTQLSGGQQRLVLLAQALAPDPPLIVLDEPTVGLDGHTRHQVLGLLRALRAQDTALLVASHDLTALRALVDEVTVLYRGWAAEQGPVAAVLDQPAHPYTAGLTRAAPTLGDVRDLRPLPDARTSAPAHGCPFAPRCTQARSACWEQRPALQPPDAAVAAPSTPDGARTVACVRGGVRPALVARGVVRTRRRARGPLRRASVAALDGVDVSVRHGETLGVVGASGAGKSTLAAVLAGLDRPDHGEVLLDEEPLRIGSQATSRRARRAVHARMQMVAQDAATALSPRMTVGASLVEPLEVQRWGRAADRVRAARDALAAVRLDPALLDRLPHTLSGGQRQRVALARALVLAPEVLIADEPFSMLDPSEQAGLLTMLAALQVARGLTLVVVSHDLAVVARLADRIVVLADGAVAEEGTSVGLLTAPSHPATRALLTAAGGQLVTTVGAGDHHATPTTTNGHPTAVPSPAPAAPVSPR